MSTRNRLATGAIPHLGAWEVAGAGCGSAAAQEPDRLGPSMRRRPARSGRLSPACAAHPGAADR